MCFVVELSAHREQVDETAAIDELVLVVSRDSTKRLIRPHEKAVRSRNDVPARSEVEQRVDRKSIRCPLECHFRIHRGRGRPAIAEGIGELRRWFRLAR